MAVTVREKITAYGDAELALEKNDMDDFEKFINKYDLIYFEYEDEGTLMTSAILALNVDAVKKLLSLGFDPLHKSTLPNSNGEQVSARDIAKRYRDILDANGGENIDLINEIVRALESEREPRQQMEGGKRKIKRTRRNRKQKKRKSTQRRR
jgi:hypothetical protein